MKRGDVLCDPGLPANFVYLVKEGAFAIESQSPVEDLKGGEGRQRFAELRNLDLFLRDAPKPLLRLSTVGRHEFVGEEAVFAEGKQYAFRVVCTSETAKLYRLTYHLFRMLPKQVLRQVAEMCQAKMNSRLKSFAAALKVRVGVETESEPESLPPDSVRTPKTPSGPAGTSLKCFAKSTMWAYQKGDLFGLSQLRQLINSHSHSRPAEAMPPVPAGENFGDFKRTQIRTQDGRIRLMTLRNCKKAIETAKHGRPHK